MTQQPIGLTPAESTSPPAPRPDAPEGLAFLVIETGPLPPFDIDAEMAHAMCRQ